MDLRCGLALHECYSLRSGSCLCLIFSLCFFCFLLCLENLLRSIFLFNPLLVLCLGGLRLSLAFFIFCGLLCTKSLRSLEICCMHLLRSFCFCSFHHRLCLRCLRLCSLLRRLRLVSLGLSCTGLLR